MYNLIVGAVDGVLGAERLLEVVEDGLELFVGPRNAPNIDRLKILPTLLMPEIGDPCHVQSAQVGSIVSLFRTGRDYHFQFNPNAAIPLIPSEHIKAAAGSLHIQGRDLTRTRWSVKSSDLYQVVLTENLIGIPSPKVFNLPLGQPDPSLIAVMMPFGAAFEPVWNTLKTTANEGGMDMSTSQRYMGR